MVDFATHKVRDAARADPRAFIGRVRSIFCNATQAVQTFFPSYSISKKLIDESNLSRLLQCLLFTYSEIIQEALSGTTGRGDGRFPMEAEAGLWVSANAA